MKIGVLTFHWAANHGAMLQAYATMQYLRQCGHEAFIIDYYPVNQELSLKNALRPSRLSVMSERFRNYQKEKKVAPFRQHFMLSCRFRTNQELTENPPEADAYITGSDQVWNAYYLLRGEGKVTPVYFLNFGRSGCKKIAMSVSFGCVEYPQEAKEQAAPYIHALDAISVREKTGLDVLESMDYHDGVVTADPTSLLAPGVYGQLCADIPVSKGKVALCILRKQSKGVIDTIHRLIASFENREVVSISDVSVPVWLATIRDAECVITNSFHCVMFCLKFHTPFMVVLEDGAKAGMNDRLFTLLDYFELRHRICSDASYTTNDMVHESIDWESIDRTMDLYANSLRAFLKNSLEG